MTSYNIYIYIQREYTIYIYEQLLEEIRRKKLFHIYLLLIFLYPYSYIKIYIHGIFSFSHRTAKYIIILKFLIFIKVIYEVKKKKINIVYIL